ncbi:MAG: hypothetical protein ABW104_09250 [Candidatus Thiodiazotropha sp. 6PLUC2]
MELLINLSVIVAFVLGMILLLLSMFVLHTYEAETKKRPPSVQFWPFNKEINEYYPGISKLGRFLHIGAIVCALPYIVKLIVST